MRKISIIVITLIIIVGFSACASGNSDKPEEIGQQVFYILKTLEAKGKQGFSKNFMTIEEVRKLGKSNKVSFDSDIRNEMTSQDRDEWNENILTCYNSIKAKGEKYDINWKNIEYSDFTYEIQHQLGVKYIEGLLSIEYNGEIYEIKTYSMWNGKEYAILEIYYF